MSAHVRLSDTFDQWRMKNNEWLSMNDPSGSSNFIKTNATTNSTSNTTGAITTAGGLGIGSSAVVGGDLTLHTDSDLRSTTNLKEIIHILSEDADEFDDLLLEDGSTVDPNSSTEGYALIELPNYVDIDGAVQIDGAVTVGVDGTGYDVKFFGDTSGQYMLWDQSGDELVLPGTQKLSFHDAAGGENIVATSDGHLEINAGTTLDITAATVDINSSTKFNVDGPTQLTGAVTFGVDDTSANVKFFGATSGSYMLWQEDVDDLVLAGASALSIDTTTDSSNTTTGSFHTDGGVGIAKKLYVGTDLDVDGTTNLDAVDIDGAVQIDNTVAVGTNGSGFDVKFFGDTSSAFMLWDASADDLILSGAAALSIDTTTDSSSTTTGSFHTDGGVGIAKKLYVGTDLDVDGTTNLDAVDIDGAVQIDNTVSVGVNGTSADVKFFGATSGSYWLWDASADGIVTVGDLQQTGTITVGENGTGHDVKLFGATASAFMEWDESEDDLILSGTAALSIDNTTDSSSTTTGSFHTDGGVGIAKKLYVGTDLDVNGTTNLDAVDIDGATQVDATFSVGVNGTSADVKFFGATSGSYWHWDASADKVIQVGSTQITGAVTVGVDGTGHDVKLFGAAAGAFMEWDASADELEIRGGAAGPGKLLLSTAEATVVDGNKLGQIDFQAPAETGTDAIVVGASIVAEADATFSASVNSTDLVFLTADSGAATEKFRIDSTGVCTFADGAIDVDIASHDGTNGLKLGGTLVTATAEQLNDIANEQTLGEVIAMDLIFA